MDQILELLDLEQLTTSVVEYFPKLVVAILILLAFAIGYRLARKPIQAALKRTSMADALVDLLVRRLFKYVIYAVGIVMAADQLGVNVTAALAGLGVAGIAIGFAAQDSVANVISGILIFWDKPFVVGDWIETEGEFGQVSDITLRTTRIRTPRNTYIVIPNKRIIDAVIENLSKHGELRVDVSIGIAYKEDIIRAREVLLTTASELDWLDSGRDTDVVVHELADSSVNLRLRVWIKDAADQQRTIFTLTERCKLALDNEGISIPFPHLQLYVDEVADQVWKGASSLNRSA